MNIIFIDIINNSITASYIILIVLLLRLFLKRYPKKFSYMLWIIVFIRLLNPLVIESEFSFFPENPQIISQQIIESTYDQVSNISENIIGAIEKSQAETLMEYKTPYVGDASSVGNIIYNLTFPEDIAYGYFELQTQKTPYGLTVYFDADKDSILKYMAKDKVDENILKHEAYLLFSLIENLDTVTFNIQYLDEMSVFEFDRQVCEIELNRNINEFSRDAMELEKLIKLTLE